MARKILLFKTIGLKLPETIPKEMDYIVDIIYMQVSKSLLCPLEHCEYNIIKRSFNNILIDSELEEYLYSQYRSFIDERLHFFLVKQIEFFAEKLINSNELEFLVPSIGYINNVTYNYDKALNHIRWYITII